MKHIISLIMLAVILVTALASCTAPHLCSYGTELCFGEENHWAECEECHRAYRYEEHTWGYGIMQTEPTPEEPGLRLYSCTKCDATKTALIPYTGMNEKEWNEAIPTEHYTNFTYVEESTVTMGDQEESARVAYYFTKGLVVVEMSGYETIEVEGVKEVESLAISLCESIVEILDYDAYRYDSETDTYTTVDPVVISLLGEPDYVTVTFADGKLATICYGGTYSVGLSEYVYESRVTLSDIGSTVIE